MVSSPMKAGAVVGVPVFSRNRSATGRTGTPPSIAAWKSAGRNVPWVSPHQVVPSGVTLTIAPPLRFSARVATVPGRDRMFSRST
jgi:hypothetical protein